MIKLKNQRILFFARSMGIGGTESIILQMCKILLPKVEMIVVISCGGENVKQLEDMGISHCLIPDICNKNPKVVWKVLKVLNSVIKEKKISIIHVHDRMAAFYVSLLKLDNVKYFATFHMNIRNKKYLTEFSYNKSQIIACGEAVKKTLIEYYRIDPKKITVIKNTIPHDLGNKKTLDEQLNTYKRQGNFIVGNIGRLTEEKGMKYFIDSYAIVKEYIPNIKYIIVGDGTLMESLKNRVNELGYTNDIIFLGFRSDIRDLISQMDCVVLSSLWEGLPLTPIEAFSEARTVIGTNVEGTNEIIIDRYNGLLVQPKNSIQIAEAIKKVLTDNKFRKELEINAYKTYIEEFSEERFANDLINFYESKL